MNIARLFAYTREIEAERDALRADRERNVRLIEDLFALQSNSEAAHREILDFIVYNRRPERITPPLEPTKPAHKQTPDEREDEVNESGLDALTIAERTAQIEIDRRLGIAVEVTTARGDGL